MKKIIEQNSQADTSELATELKATMKDTYLLLKKGNRLTEIDSLLRKVIPLIMLTQAINAAGGSCGFAGTEPDSSNLNMDAFIKKGQQLNILCAPVNEKLLKSRTVFKNTTDSLQKDRSSKALVCNIETMKSFSDEVKEVLIPYAQELIRFAPKERGDLRNELADFLNFLGAPLPVEEMPVGKVSPSPVPGKRS